MVRSRSVVCLAGSFKKWCQAIRLSGVSTHPTPIAGVVLSVRRKSSPPLQVYSSLAAAGLAVPPSLLDMAVVQKDYIGLQASSRRSLPLRVSSRPAAHPMAQPPSVPDTPIPVSEVVFHRTPAAMFRALACRPSLVPGGLGELAGLGVCHLAAAGSATAICPGLPSSIHSCFHTGVQEPARLEKGRGERVRRGCWPGMCWLLRWIWLGNQTPAELN